MRFLLMVIFIAILSAAAELILPWWSVAIVSFVVSVLFVQKEDKAFLIGFSGVGLCWLVVALIRDFANDHILSNRMAMLLKLPGHGMLITLTVLIGALVGGFASWAGAYMKPR